MISDEQRQQICQRVRELRKEKRYSQKEMADILGLERSSYAYYELGRVQLSIDVLCTLTQLYDVSADYILGLSDNRASGEKRGSGGSLIQYFHSMGLLGDRKIFPSGY